MIDNWMLERRKFDREIHLRERKRFQENQIRKTMAIKIKKAELVVKKNF